MIVTQLADRRQLQRAMTQADARHRANVADVHREILGLSNSSIGGPALENGAVDAPIRQTQRRRQGLIL